MKRIICLITLCTVLVTSGVMTTPAQGSDRAAAQRAVLTLINKARSSRGLRAVRLQKNLRAAAVAHSRQMISKEYFSHDSAGGASYAERLRAAGYKRAEYDCWTVGEVIGWSEGSAGTARAVFKAWMRSSGHRAVILDRRWRDVGVGCAQGTFQGIDDTLMFTVDFGRRIR